MKKTTIFCIALLSTLLSSLGDLWAQSGVVRYVKAGASGDGSSWSKASGDLQAMIDLSEVGDAVWIAEGTYMPKRLIKETKKRSFAFMMKDGVSLYGGFKGDESSLDDRKKEAAPEPLKFLFAHKTVLSGNIDGKEDVWKRVIDEGASVRHKWQVIGNEENANHLLYLASAATNKTIVDGFVLRDAHADVWSVSAGGAALYAWGNVELRNSEILHNVASHRAENIVFYGGAVSMMKGDNRSRVENCLFEENMYMAPTSVASGGSLYIQGGEVSDCLFRGSIAFDAGGALALQQSTVRNSLFEGCYASDGGAIYSMESTVEQCRVYNSTALIGGGISARAGLIHHTIVANCYADDPAFGDAGGGQGGGILLAEKARAIGCIVTNCTAWLGGGVAIKEGELYHSTIQHCSLREGSPRTQRNYDDYKGLPLAKSAKEGNNILADNVATSNFIVPTEGLGYTTDPTIAEQLRKADWALQPTSQFVATGRTIQGVEERVDMRGNMRLREGKIDCGALALPSETPEPEDDVTIILTFVKGDKTITFGAGGLNGTSFEVDFGDGQRVKYEGAKNIEHQLVGNKLRLYGDDILILKAVNQGVAKVNITKATKLTALHLDGNELQELDITHQPNLRNLYCMGNKIARPINFSAQSKMNVVSIARNFITGTLDLSHIKGLTEISCFNNQLSEVKLPLEAPLLKKIDCDSNRLSEIDFSHCTALEEVYVAHNQLVQLDLSHSRELTKIYAPGNRLKQIPLEQNKKLITLNLNGNKLIRLNLAQQPLLQDLYVASNALTQVDLSHNPELKWFSIRDNKLEALVVNDNPNLVQIRADHNNIKQLDLSRNSKLVTLHLGNNQLERLNVLNQKSLIWFTCDSNKLASIDLQANPGIAWLECEGNALTQLDVSNQKNLQKLFAYGNRLTTLDLSNNKGLQGLFLHDNQLPVAQLDAILAGLGDVRDVEINENNQEWAKQVNVAGNPLADQCNTEKAKAMGWTVILGHPNALNEIPREVEMSCYYLAATNELIAGEDILSVALFTLEGEQIWYVQPRSQRIEFPSIPSGHYVALVELASGQRLAVKLGIYH